MTRRAAAAALSGPSEEEFQAQVVEFARLLGWRVYKTYDSRRSPAGFPDLCMARRARLVFLELKTDAGGLTPEQREWIEALAATPAEAYVVRPRDWPLIEKYLQWG
jgi:hypothetical protein